MCHSIYRRLTSKFTSARSRCFLPASLEKLSHQQLMGGFSLETKPSTKQKTMQNSYSLFGLERKMRRGVGVSSRELCWKHGREAGGSWYQGKRAGPALKIWVLASALTLPGKVISIEPLFLLCTPIHLPPLCVCQEYACTHAALGCVTASFGSQVPRTRVHPSLQAKHGLTGGSAVLPHQMPSRERSTSLAVGPIPSSSGKKFNCTHPHSLLLWQDFLPAPSVSHLETKNYT